jgi:hypothetical protein
MRFWTRRLGLLLIVIAPWSVLADDGSKRSRKGASWLLPMPGIKANKKIPGLKAVVGHDWGRDVSSHREIVTYLKALSKAAPERCKLVQYGSSYEKRGLYQLIISAPENIKNLDRIRKNNLLLAEPRTTSYGQAREIIEQAPAIVWLAYSVHGNEISSSDAALVTAYHLIAAQDKKTRDLLKNTVVIIDALQNPDGRDRFVNVFRETRGVFLDPHPSATEHVERWPGGRSNHYYFDMNRDWFRHSQKETKHKVAAFLRWYPHIYVDAHEMGRNSSFFFVPPTDPINPYVLPSQKEWFLRIGKHQGKRFDQYGFDYTTREMFDAFYPGYGSEWPTMQGGIGVLWEMASARGLVIDRDDDTRLYYHDGVRRHYLSGLSTIEVASKHRKKLLSDFYAARFRGVQLGLEGRVKHFFLLQGKRPARAALLARILRQNGIEVRRVNRPLKALCRSAGDKQEKRATIPAGSYYIPVAQPAGRLVRTLLDRHVPMDSSFIERQLDRMKKSLGNEIYDVTAWSLPLAFDVQALTSGEARAMSSSLWNGKSAAGVVTGARSARIAYLINGDDDGAPKALCHWLREGLRVHVTDRALVLGARDFPRGTLILKVHENRPLTKIVASAARRFGLTIHGTNTSFVESGAHFGGPSVHWIRAPRILLLTDRPTRYSSGHTWFLFDQVLSYPTTRVAGRSLSRIDLSKYNVLILPSGRYSGPDAPDKRMADKLKRWVRQGGTLILVKEAAQWAMSKEIGLLSAKRALLKSETGKGPGHSPSSVPGVFFNSDIFMDHWLTESFEAKLPVFLSGDLFFDKMDPAKGRSLVTFADREKILASGFCWSKTLDLAAGKSFMVYQSSGRGHIVAFADDPNYRSMYPALQRLFINASLFGPSH